MAMLAPENKKAALLLMLPTAAQAIAMGWLEMDCPKGLLTRRSTGPRARGKSGVVSGID